MPEIRVQDEQGNIHVFPDGSTPDMIASAMGVKPQVPAWANQPMEDPSSRIKPTTYLEDFGNWARQTAQTRQQEELKDAAAGQGSPTRAAIRSFAPNALADMSDTLRGVLSPVNVAAGATMAAFPPSAAAIMPYFAGQGAKQVYQASTSPEGLANPERAQQALMGGATVAGSLAGLKASGPAISEMLPSVKRGSAAFQHLDSALGDMTPVTEPKFNIDRVANSARKVSDRFSATDLKSAPPLVTKLLDRATDTAQPMTWPELREFKTDLNTLIWDREIPSQFKGPLKNLATDIDTTLRQGADARAYGEMFSKANTDFRRSFKMQDVAEKAGPYAGAVAGSEAGALANQVLAGGAAPWLRYIGAGMGYPAGKSIAGALARSITERDVPPQEFPEISPSKVRTTQPQAPKSSQLASVKSVSGGSTPQPTGAEPEIEAIRRGASESVQPQQAKAAQVQQAKRFTPAGTSEQPTPDIWQQAKGRFEESETKRAQSQDPEARKEAREKKSGEKIASANLSQLTKDMQSLGYDKASALARAKAALQQHPNDYKAATDAAIRGK